MDIIIRTYCWTLQASQSSRARLVFRDDFSAILLASSGGRLSPSFLHVCCRTLHNCNTIQNTVRTPYQTQICRYYFIVCGSSNSHAQTPTLDGRDDFTGGGTAEDESAGGHVLLHGPAESMLGILCQLVHLSQHNHYKRRERK